MKFARFSTQGTAFNLGRAVRDARQLRGLTQDALAQATGVERSQISRIEHGHPKLASTNVQRVCTFLGLSASGPAEQLAAPEQALLERVSRLLAQAPANTLAIERVVSGLEALVLRKSQVPIAEH